MNPLWTAPIPRESGLPSLAGACTRYLYAGQEFETLARMIETCIHRLRAIEAYEADPGVSPPDLKALGEGQADQLARLVAMCDGDEGRALKLISEHAECERLEFIQQLNDMFERQFADQFGDGTTKA